MSKQDNSLYEQQERRIQAQSDAFITLLTKRGILADQQINDEKKRIVAITLQLYPPSMIFYDTENQEIVVSERYESSNNPVVFKGDYIELRNGEKYDMNGKLITDVPEEKPMQDIKLSGYESVCKELIATERVAVALYVDVGYKTGVVLQNSDGASVKLDYYADNAIILRDDLVLIYSVGGEGVILAELK